METLKHLAVPFTSKIPEFESQINKADIITMSYSVIIKRTPFQFFVERFQK